MSPYFANLAAQNRAAAGVAGYTPRPATGQDPAGPEETMAGLVEHAAAAATPQGSAPPRGAAAGRLASGHAPGAAAAPRGGPAAEDIGAPAAPRGGGPGAEEATGPAEGPRLPAGPAQDAALGPLHVLPPLEPAPRAEPPPAPASWADVYERVRAWVAATPAPGEITRAVPAERAEPALAGLPEPRAAQPEPERPGSTFRSEGHLVESRELQLSIGTVEVSVEVPSPAERPQPGLATRPAGQRAPDHWYLSRNYWRMR